MDYQDQEGVWLTISEYELYRGISTSTVRRYIKAGRVKTKKDAGKYYIFVTGENYSRSKNKPSVLEDGYFQLKSDYESLQTECDGLKKKIAELNAIIDLYENNRRDMRTPERTV